METITQIEEEMATCPQGLHSTECIRRWLSVARYTGIVAGEGFSEATASKEHARALHYCNVKCTSLLREEL